ncbi:MAG: membrane protein insertase, yidc/oxa1 family, preprotein translocase subunit YidC [Candidatus Gottesmanbacteria bacterium GW2011_GWA2_43_14]|uniref:Membrane protein insertase, yidc/oxa1 family, preprotein translocase subunit YidC n=1 Tax=Candidatus Gottesmanbacteria bacterium GW2011_GWA2_43_14 TaxID=1618443 RepID=A0A0G1DJ67_9BACT|nr:MAG: membrane protein insertase, yidc/oxa1 family, preprotein translocase subunit YidC [Candidatus Gottesmanbacteria bacterium GW2011_GWA2_43_14]
MFDPNNIFHSFLIIPILNILLGIYNFLQLLHIPSPLGFSLILLTVLIRLVLHPLTASQLKSAQKLAKLKPEIDRINREFKGDKTRLQQEQLKLYQQAGINPAGGCLPLLVQMPILIALYNLFFQLLNADKAQVVAEINKVAYLPFLKITSLDLNFLGTSLAFKPSDWQSKGYWLLAIPIITGLLQYLQTRMMMPAQVSDKSKQIVKDNKKEDKKGSEDMASAMQKQMSLMMPVMIGFFAYSFPLGLSLYWNTFTVFGIIQQYQIQKKSR